MRMNVHSWQSFVAIGRRVKGSRANDAYCILRRANDADCIWPSRANTCQESDKELFKTRHYMYAQRQDREGASRAQELMLFVLERKGLVHADMHEMIKFRLDIYVCVCMRGKDGGNSARLCVCVCVCASRRESMQQTGDSTG